MPNEQTERSPRTISGEYAQKCNPISIEADRALESGPPLPRTSNSIPKQWQPPKNESTPSNRSKKQ